MNPYRRVWVSGHRLSYPDGTYEYLWTATVLNERREHLHTRSFPTWADAMAFADRLARFIRTSHKLTEGTDR